MEKLTVKVNQVRVFFRTDWNIVRAKRLVRRGARAAPRGAARYISNKVPFANWIAGYSVRWLPGDVLSGVTVGIVLALQAVNLAVPIPGGISVQQTLLASWLPGFIYALLGTSKSKKTRLLTAPGPSTCSLSLDACAREQIVAVAITFLFRAVHFGWW